MASYTLTACLLVTSVITHSVMSEKSYAGYHLITVPIRSPIDLAAVNSLQEQPIEFDFWDEPPAVGRTASIAVTLNYVDFVVTFLSIAGLEPKIVTTNLQAWIDAERAAIVKALAIEKVNGRFLLDLYHRFSAINHHLEMLSGHCKGGFYSAKISCYVINIGKTYEGRDMKVFHIYPMKAQRVKSIWIDAGIHAREWAASATAIYLLSKLLETASDPQTQILLSNFEWFILPVANPDGYEYSHTDDRLWRKTRSATYHTDCVGVDPNRNWDFHWNEIGASDNACSQVYAGPNAFSEKETQNIAGFIMANRERFLVYLTIHAYGQYWLTPWGYTSDFPVDYADLVDVAMAGATAIQAQSGNSFTVGTSTNVLYAAAGGSDDWAKGVAGIKYSFTVELRDKGRHGFLLPQDQILPCGEEMWAGLKAMAGKVMEHIEDGRAT